MTDNALDTHQSVRSLQPDACLIHVAFGTFLVRRLDVLFPDAPTAAGKISSNRSTISFLISASFY